MPSAKAQVGIKAFGINFSPYMDGQNPNSSPAPQISVSQIQARLQPLVPLTKWIRSYGSTNGLENIPSAAKSLGFKVAAGAWISSDANANAREINNLIANANAGYVDVAIVGSEAILRNDVSVTQLIAYINQVRQAIPAGIPVGTADIYGTFLANPSLIAAGDIIFANLFPFWEGIPQVNAMCSLESEYQQLVNAAAGKPVWISETGWPSEGDAVGAAEPSLPGANLYSIQFLRWANDNGISSFYFEAYDEGWREISEGAQGAHWGIFDASGVLKHGMDGFFNGQQLMLSCSLIASQGATFTPAYVPPLGTADLLEVQASNLRTAGYAVATYVQVNGRWWSNYLAVPLNLDGTAKIDIVSAANSPNATSIAAFLIPVNTIPPQVAGGNLPAVPGTLLSFQISRTASSITGLITDSHSNPIPNAVISGEGSLGQVTSAKDGRYSFFNVTATGTNTLTVTAANYVFPSSPAPVAVGAGNTVINFVGDFLQPQSVSPASGVGAASAFTFTFSDASGAADIGAAQMLINSTLSAESACYITVYPASRTIYLYNDAGTALIGPVVAGGAGSVSNSQCTITGAGSNVTASGNALSITVAVTFPAGFNGQKNIYSFAQTTSGLNSAWRTVGAWTVGSPIAVVSASPIVGVGASNTFMFVFSDASGAGGIAMTQILINRTFSGASACYITVYPASRTIYLYNDAATSLTGPATFGASGTVSNSQCSVSAAASSLTISGDTLTVNLAVAALGGLSGTQTVSGLAQTASGLNSGWKQLGSWRLESTPPQALSVSPSRVLSSSQTLSFTFLEASGASAIGMTQMLINGSLSGAGACYVTVYPASKAIYLYNDAATSLIGPAFVGGTGTLSNSQCTVSVAGSSIVASGNVLTVTLTVSVPGSFPGTRNIYSFAQTIDGLNSVWEGVGTWTTPNAPPQIVSIWPSAGFGNSATLQFTYLDGFGGADIGMTQMLVNSTLSGAPACYVTVFPASRTMYLYNDAGTALIGPAVLGGTGTLSNSQCTVSAAGSSIAPVDVYLSVTLAITFADNFDGAKRLYGFAQSLAGVNSAWESLGTWTIGDPPQVTSVSPAAGSAPSKTYMNFTFTGYVTAGASDIAMTQMLFNSALSGAPACYITVYPASRTLYLYNDAGTALIGPVVLGGTGAVNNSQCTVSAASSTVSVSGDQLSVTVAVSFAVGFSGTKNIYSFAQTIGGQTSGWQTLGTWTTINDPPLVVSVHSSWASGARDPFTFTFVDPSGPSAIAMTQMLINPTFSGAPACYITVFPDSQTTYLYNDQGTALLGPLTPGDTRTISNSQCNVSASDMSASGDTLTVTVWVVFAGSSSNAKNVYALAQDHDGLTSPWKLLGNWMAGIPQFVSVSPSAGSGSSSTFTLQISSAGVSNISAAELLINSTLSAPACDIAVDPIARTISLYSDTGTISPGPALGPAPVGSTYTLFNSQCSVRAEGSSITTSGATLIITLAISFQAAFGGQKNIYATAQTAGGESSVWQQFGTWIP